MRELTIHIIDAKKEYYLELRDLLFVKADGNYVDVFLVKTQYKSIRIQIGQLWKKISELDVPHDLVRIDRSTIVNLRRVEFINPKKGTIVLSREEEKIQLPIAKAAFNGLKEKVTQLMNDSSRGFSIVNRPGWKRLPTIETKHEGHAYIDLGLPSGTLWALEDMSIPDSDFAMYGMNLYDSPYTIFNDATFEKDFGYVFEEDTARIKWFGSWCIPTIDEWKELLTECSPLWAVDENGYVVCVLTGKNGNQIVLSSVSPHRGLCTYWTSSEMMIDGGRSINTSVELHEPYANEPWYHFISDLNRPECNLHAVISAKDL